MMQRPTRKPLRLKEYDYSSNGYYFVTICTEKRKAVLGRIHVGQGLAPAECQLTVYGKIAEKELLALEKRFAFLRIDQYTIMPNHIHAILVFERTAAGASPCPTLSDVICAYKSLTTLACKKVYPVEKLFQNSFYDHVIRDESDYLNIWEYVHSNPEKWVEDRFYIE